MVQKWLLSRLRRSRWFWLVLLLGLASPWLERWLPGWMMIFETPIGCVIDSIYDGDTLRATCDGGKVKVRLHCIDAPEMAQKPWGREARDYLRQITPSSVQLVVKETDRYGRKVADVRGADGQSLNLAMVAAGQAAVYQQYCHDGRFFAAAQEAKRRRLGIWSKTGEHQTPWRWRLAKN